MPVQMIELEEVSLVDFSDVALESTLVNVVEGRFTINPYDPPKFDC